MTDQQRQPRQTVFFQCYLTGIMQLRKLLPRIGVLSDFIQRDSFAQFQAIEDALFGFGQLSLQQRIFYLNRELIGPLVAIQEKVAAIGDVHIEGSLQHHAYHELCKLVKMLQGVEGALAGLITEVVECVTPQFEEVNSAATNPAN